jgi:nitroimidazol reductase NimA-like FMN-containing flavoprotein (pyridoxamine 5'-phosphate oxidase superfamily)
MARIPAELGMTAEELDELMTTSWNMRIATIGPGERINVTPLWFGWAGGRVYFYCRGQKIANLRRSPVCTVLVDRNERFPELQGAMFQGHATVLENDEQESADPHLEEVRWLMGRKYAGGHGESQSAEPGRYAVTASGRSARWVVFEPSRLISWDNHKLPERRSQA